MAIGIGGQRNSRLGVPRINQNQPHLRAGLAKRIAVSRPTYRTGLASRAPAAPTPAAVSTVPPTQSTPTDPLKTTQGNVNGKEQIPGQPAGPTPAPTAPPAPAAPPSANPFAPPAYTGVGPDPRDATYWQNLSKLEFNDTTQYAKELAEQTVADTGYSSALQQAIQARSGQERELGESAIRGNLGASGWLDRTQGEQVRDYTQQRASASLTKEQEDAARLAARNALKEGYGIDAAGLLGEAAGRYAAGQEGAAETGEPESSPAAAGGGAASKAGKGGNKGGGKNKGGGSHAKGSGGTTAPKGSPYKSALSKARKAK
jgi:hypothetical protein